MVLYIAIAQYRIFPICRCQLTIGTTNEELDQLLSQVSLPEDTFLADNLNTACPPLLPPVYDSIKPDREHTEFDDRD